MSSDTTRYRRPSDLPSLLFMLGLAASTTCLLATASIAVKSVLLLPQALLILGCQEAKHLAVHRRFLSNRRLNDAIGMVCAAHFGMNLEAYRHFHLRHHRSVCTDQDPEGALYAMSWRSRIIWLLAPLELPWVAYHLQRLAWPMVPPSRRRALTVSTAVQVTVVALLALLAWHHPHELLWAYALPLAIACWIDFPLTQGEHYGMPVLPAADRRRGDELANDIELPAGLGWLTLHRSLHRVHHCNPGAAWAEAPRALRDGPLPMPYARFVHWWWMGGPRQWPATGIAANNKT